MDSSQPSVLNFEYVSGRRDLSGLRVGLPGALHRANDFARTDAAGAYADRLGRAADDGLHRLEVREPTRLGLDVGVGNVVTGDRTFFAIFTELSHDGKLSF